ncbi:MAG TPA: protein kinase, partial [Gemmataceae bacterium]|nr:protein kinase [Gemmataceae bacterium]
REGHPPDHGRQLVQALERVQDTHPEGSGDRAAGPDPWRRGTPGTSTEAGGVGGQTPLTLLSKLDYPRASAWIVARLAEGLQHAHQRGILHRDIKPSNILIGADGQPMLLDFNLAHDQKADFAETVLGGTVAYMAPEHLHALAGRTAALIGRVDHRSDIYSLGMVLHEMLTGQSPFQEKASYSALPLQLEAMAVERSKAIPSARQQRADLPWSLESILRKCLDPRPDRRYQQAEHLAEDLRRFLDDRPLKYAPELSQAERIRKWARRHPRLTSAGSVALATLFLLLTAAAALAAVSGRLASTTDELKTSQARERKQRYEAGTIRALCLVNTSARLQDHLRQGAGICEETLGLYGLLEGEGWQEPADWARLPAEDRRKLAEDTRELLLLLAGARVRLAPGDPAVLRSALALLDRAEAIPDLEPSRALWLDRAEYLNQLGRADEADAVRRKAEEIPAATARDHYLLATVHARRGDAEGHARALAELDQALRLNPRHYWSWVQKGICHLERGEDLQAARSFGACIGLWPDFAWGYFNHGYVLDRSGRKAEAIADYTAALARDPDLVPAYVNRGLARLELRQHEAALADFAEAQRRGKAEASLHAARGMALEALGRHAEADAAFRLAFAAVGTEAEQLRIRWTYGFAVSARLPEEARRAFDDVLRHDPRHAQALYGRAMLAMAQDRSAEALRFFDRALEADPGFLEARRYRAVLLARTGSLERASQDINWCLEREPRSGATLYAAACVAARAGQRLLDPGLTDQALNLLERALADGIDTQRAAQDPDLAGLRDHPRFKQLLDQPRGTREPGDQTVAPRR